MEKISVGSYNTNLTSALVYAVSDIASEKYDTITAEYTDDFDTYARGDRFLFFADVTVLADEDPTFKLSDWVCTDSDGNKSDAVDLNFLGVTDPETTEDGEYKTYTVSVDGYLEDAGTYTVTFNSPNDVSTSLEIEIINSFVMNTNAWGITNSATYFGSKTDGYYITANDWKKTCRKCRFI